MNSGCQIINTPVKVQPYNTTQANNPKQDGVSCKIDSYSQNQTTPTQKKKSLKELFELLVTNEDHPNKTIDRLQSIGSHLIVNCSFIGFMRPIGYYMLKQIYKKSPIIKHYVTALDEKVYRGNNPDDEHMQKISKLGIKTIVNLRYDADKQNDKALAEKYGINWVNRPVAIYGPQCMKEVKEILSMLCDPKTGPAYIHCYAGMERTGFVSACYQIAKGMDANEAIQKESLNYKADRDWHYANFNFLRNHQQELRDYYKEINPQ